MQVNREIEFEKTDLAFMALVYHHQAVRVGARDLQVRPAIPVQLCIHSFGGAVSRRTQTKMIRRGSCCSSTPPYPRPSSPMPPHLVRRLHVRARRQKLLHHPSMTSLRSPMQRRPSVLLRATAVRQAAPLSTQVRALRSAPAPPSVPHLHSTSQYGRAGAYGSAFRQFPPQLRYCA